MVHEDGVRGTGNRNIERLDSSPSSGIKDPRHFGEVTTSIGNVLDAASQPTPFNKNTASSYWEAVPSSTLGHPWFPAELVHRDSVRIK